MLLYRRRKRWGGLTGGTCRCDGATHSVRLKGETERARTIIGLAKVTGGMTPTRHVWERVPA